MLPYTSAHQDKLLISLICGELQRCDFVFDMSAASWMNSIGEMTPNPCNIPVSTIPKRQVSLRRKVGVQFCVNSSLDRGYLGGFYLRAGQAALRWEIDGISQLNVT
jgi:hypothetical protein